MIREPDDFDAYRNAWIVYLVHGTWGRGFWKPQSFDPARPRWFEEGSRFRDKLSSDMKEKGLKIAITKAHLWSGANSIVHRDEAGKSLASLLLEDREKHPDHWQLVIGHSHGGTVATRALSWLRSWTNQGSRYAGLMVITLATPFVQVIRSENGRPNEDWAAFFAALLSLSCLWAIHRPSMLSLVLVVFAYLTTFAALIKQAMVFAKYLDGGSRPVVTLEEKAGFGALDWGQTPMMVLRPTEDEAAFALTAGLIANRVTRLIGAILRSGFLRPLTHPGLLITILVVCSLPLLLSVFKVLDEGTSWLQTLFVDHQGVVNAMKLVLFLYVALGFMGTCVILFSAGVSRELFFYPHVEVSVDSAPDNTGQVSIYTLSRFRKRGARMQHSIYDDESCTSLIVYYLMSRARIIPPGFPRAYLDRVGT